MGIVTTSSQTALSQSPETIYDFVANQPFLPANPAKIDVYHAAIARELEASHASR